MNKSYFVIELPHLPADAAALIHSFLEKLINAFESQYQDPLKQSYYSSEPTVSDEIENKDEPPF